MANVLTDLAADIYKAADVVGRELTGYIPSCTVNADGSERAALNDSVRSFATRAATAVNNNPSMTIPEGTDQTVDNKTMSITKSRGVQIPWTGEDIRHVNNGSGFETIYGDQITQAMRTLTNEIESDLAGEAYVNASRAVGTAGTTPFVSNFDNVAELRQILVDNGMPINDLRTTMVLSTGAGTNLRQLAQLQKVNEAGNDRLLRQGELLNLQGIMLKESAQAPSHTPGTVAASPDYLVDQPSSPTGYDVGDTTIHLDTGSGTHVAGDVINFVGDTNKYVINTGSASSGDKDIVLAKPGLRLDLADGVASTIESAYTANVAFHQTALELAMRAPAMPVGGDAAVDVMTVQDPWSGLVFEIAVYKGFQKMMINVGAVWGVKAWKEEHIALLMG